MKNYLLTTADFLLSSSEAETKFQFFKSFVKPNVLQSTFKKHIKAEV